MNTMRSVIAQHKDLFYEDLLDELMTYSDILPAGASSTLENNEPDPLLKKATTILMCTNASIIEKLPLLICGSRTTVIANENCVHSRSEDASISDTFLEERLNPANDRMSNSDWKILLHRDHMNAFRDLTLIDHVRHVFFPNVFSPLLKSLKRYVEGIKEHGYRWNAENVVKSLLEARLKVPRNLIIVSFERSFRTDNCFLEIHCDAWEDVKIGTSFKKFVRFEDKFSTDTSHRQCIPTGNLGSKQIVRLIDHFDWIALKKETEWLNYHIQANRNLTDIFPRKDCDYERKSSLKRSYDEAQLSEDDYEEANNVTSSDDSISRKKRRNNEVIVTVPTPAKLPKIINVRAVGNATRASKSKRIHSKRANATTSRRNADRNYQLDETVNKRNRDRSIGSSTEAEYNTSDIVLQQVHDDDTSAIESEKEANAMVVSASRDEIKLADLNANCSRPSRISLKRRRSQSDNAEGSRNNSDDDDDDDEPERKRSCFDSNRAKLRCETLVSGLYDFIRILSTVSAEMLSDNNTHWSRLTRQSCETERSIFTIRFRRN